MNLLQSLFRRNDSTIRRYDGADFSGMDPLDFSWSFGGNTYYGLPGVAGNKAERIESNFAGMVQGAYKRNGVIFACIRARLSVFSEGRFAYRKQSANGRLGEFFGDATDRRTSGSSGLQLLQEPWQNGTTGDLLTRMLQDADLAGNAFWTVRNGSLKRMRPDWVTIVMGSHEDPELLPDDLDAELLGYGYWPGGFNSKTEAIYLPADEVAHFAPTPDPIAHYRGMSWITPVIREIQADTAATVHKLAFFENGATLQTIVSFKDMKQEVFEAFVKKMDLAHKGATNAYKTLYLGGGADATVVGSNLQQLDFKVVQGAGESLALDTPLPTPSGWTTMGDVEVGDRLLGADGRPVVVTGTSPVHEGRPCYRVAFIDGTSIVADADHLWQVKYCRTRIGVFRTEQLIDTEYVQDNGWRAFKHHVPMASPLELAAKDLAVDPYVLGLWLGDGTARDATIACGRDDAEETHQRLESCGYRVTRHDRRTCVMFQVHGLTAGLRGLGVLGEKHIPAGYLRASLAQRLALLQGLMDSDGTVGRTATAEFYNTNERLARETSELLRTLGYAPTLRTKTDDRETRYLDLWKVGFTPRPEAPAFRLKRKLARCKTQPVRKHDWRAIVSIEPVDSVAVRCVKVDAVDSLYLAGEGMVVTHNTRIAAAAGVHPVIVGLSEGMQGSSLNAGNFGQARRLFSEGTLSTLWRNVASSMATLVPPPSGAELVIDKRDIPFLREDATDAAKIAQIEASTIVSLGAGGYKRPSIIAAVVNRDMTLLEEDPNWVTVQLQAAAGKTGGPAPDPSAPSSATPVNGKTPSAAVS